MDLYTVTGIIYSKFDIASFLTDCLSRGGVQEVTLGCGFGAATVSLMWILTCARRNFMIFFATFRYSRIVVMLSLRFPDLVFVLALVLPSISVFAESAEEKGLAIAQEANRRDDGWVDSKVNLEMVLKNAKGDESRRRMRLRNLEVENDGDKSLTIFDTPADIKGTGLLSFSHKVEPDDQWLNLPALKRVKRIASKNKSGPFVGSEFAFEDLSSQEVEKYKYRYLRDEVLDGQETFVIERYPVDKYSGYTRQIAWVDKEHYRMLKVDYFDRKNSLLKTLHSTNYQKYLGEFWRPGSMVMYNHQTQRSTELHWQDYEFSTGLKDSDFTRNSLQRAR